MNTLGIIGGTGLDNWGDAESVVPAETPYGAASAELQVYRYAGARILFLARHGHTHRIPPHRVNYRANCWALKNAGADAVLAVNAVGGIAAAMTPGRLVIPDQIIDYTWGREHTYSDSAEVPLKHVDFESPYAGTLRNALVKAADSSNLNVVDGATHGVTQGPRLETTAEVRRLRRDGCDVVGMTAMPEAALARELDLEYAGLNVVSNRAAGLSDEVITMEDILAVLEDAMVDTRRLITAMIELL